MKERFARPRIPREITIAVAGILAGTGASGGVLANEATLKPNATTESANPDFQSPTYKSGDVTVSFPSETSFSQILKGDDFWGKVDSITEVRSAEDIIKDVEAAYETNPTAEDIWPLEYAKEALMIGETGVTDPNYSEKSPDEQTILLNKLAGYYMFVSQLAEKIHPNTGNDRFLNDALEAAKRAKDTITGFDFEEYTRNDMFQQILISSILPNLYKDPRNR